MITTPSQPGDHPTGGDTVQGMLRGFTIGITADRRWDEQASLFDRRGATVIHGPSIRTLPLGSDAGLREATESVIAHPPAALVANTGLGIRSWFSAAENWGMGDALLDALSKTRIYARGPKASGAIHTVGLEIVAKAATERLTEVIELAMADLSPGETVVFQADGGGAPAELERFGTVGAEVLVVPVYQWTIPDDPSAAVRLAEAVVARKVHAVTFTAGPAIRNWMLIAADHGMADELRSALCSGDVVIGCVGPVCADVAAKVGIESSRMVVPAAFRLGPLVRVVADELVRMVVTVELGGGTLSIAGNRVALGDQEVVLSDLDARLLAALASPAGSLRTKADLATVVWRDAHTDPHAIEAAIARLRARLQPLGLRVDVLRRRGYVLTDTVAATRSADS